MIKPTFLIAPVLLVGSALMLTSAQAEVAGPFMANRVTDRIFITIDTDGDGRIDTAEIDAFRQARFSQLDRDGDGRLTADEVDQALARLRRGVELIENVSRSRFDALDTDGDGALTESELAAGNTALILADADSDGVITREEVLRLATAILPSR